MAEIPALSLGWGQSDAQNPPAFPPTPYCQGLVLAPCPHGHSAHGNSIPCLANQPLRYSGPGMLLHDQARNGA